MLKLVSILGAAPKGGVKRDDDFVDRLSNRYTVGIIVVFAVIVSMTQWIGKPITCWCPKHFTGSHCKFTTNYCWIRNTYYLPYAEEIPDQETEATRDYIVYYQWLPFILLAQAAMFYAPSIIWHGLNQKSGMDADHILATAGKLVKQENMADSGSMRLIVHQLDRFLRAPKSARQGWQVRFKKCLNILCCQCFGARMGNYLVVLYLFTKLLYIANAIGQLYLLTTIFNTNYENFGVEFFRLFNNDPEYEENSPVFPRNTMCDFEVRRPGNVQRYTVQCVLPINHYAEKMYVFLWFWLLFLAVVSAVSFLTWLTRSIKRSDRLQFIQNHLRPDGYMDDPDADTSTAEFLDTYLKQDGAFLHRLIIHNTSNICCTEILAAQYQFWLDKVKGKKELSFDSDSEEDNKKHLLPS